jgi:hypothetical protein
VQIHAGLLSLRRGKKIPKRIAQVGYTNLLNKNTDAPQAIDDKG